MTRFYVDDSGQWSGGGRVVLDNLAEAASAGDVLRVGPRGGTPLIPRNVPTSLRSLLHPFVWMPQNALPWGPPAPGEAGLQRQLRVASSVVAARARAMVRISGAIPPLRRRPTSAVLHNVLDEAFEDLVGGLVPTQHGSFVCVGSAHSYRALPQLIRGFATYRASGGRTDLLIQTSAGTPSEGRLIAAAAEQVPGLQVRTGGAERAEVAALMLGSAGVVFPSLVEASPVTLLEAQALGRSVACSDIMAHRELLDGSRVVDFFTATSEAESAAAMHRLDERGPFTHHELTEPRFRRLRRQQWAQALRDFLDQL